MKQKVYNIYNICPFRSKDVDLSSQWSQSRCRRGKQTSCDLPLPCLWLPLPTSISHWAEDVLCNIQDAVSCFSMASNRMGSTGILFDVLKKLIESMSDTCCSHAHLFEEALVIGGPLRCLYTALYWLGHQLACLNQLLLAHWGADCWGHHLECVKWYIALTYNKKF